MHEGARLQAALNQQLSTLERSQKNYEKAFREAERAEDAYRKADADLNLSRADVEKHRITSSIKNHQSEDTKTEYAKQLQKTNELQNQHYQVLFFFASFSSWVWSFPSIFLLWISVTKPSNANQDLFVGFDT